MPPVTDQAIILQAFPYSETSKILRLATRDHGIRSVIAKGARRPRSRFGGLIEPFGEGIVTLYLKSTRELQTLGGFDLGRSRQTLGRNLLRFGSAALLAEVVIRTGSEEPQPHLFEGLSSALDRLDRVSDDEIEAAALAEIWALVRRLGFAPALEHCLVCGRTLPAGEDALFDYAAGGTRCSDCGNGPSTRRVPARARSTLLALARNEAVALDRTAAHWQLLGRFLTYHVLEGSSLRSFDFLTRILDMGSG